MPVYDRVDVAAGLNSSINRVRARLGPSHIALAPLLSTASGSGYHNARVTSSPGKGREVTANETLGAGSQVLVEDPYVHEQQCLAGNAVIIGTVRVCVRIMIGHEDTTLCYIPHLVSNLPDMPEKDIQSYSNSASFCATALYLPASCIDSLVTIFAQIRCNRFAVKSNTKSQSANMVIHVDETLGSAVYLQASMLNHSCQPNAFVSFNGLQIKVLCSVGLAKGQEITISYGPLASRHSQLDRQHELQEKYLFQCLCTACCESIPMQSLKYRCTSGCESDTIQHSVQTCPSCGKAINWEQIDKIEKQIDQIKDGPCTLQQIKRALKLQLTIYNPDALIIGSTYDNIAATYANAGDFAAAAGYCSQSLDIVKKQYGIDSLESADELFKLATLLFNAMKPKEAYKAVLNCIGLFCKLGLDRVRTDDMEELKGMRRALDNSQGH
ncbi:hypothetical protein NQZ79_g1296 [Umbelopsis isabellina]|nr:hypothetical protein NQZ79_g1296 [Umbelopsis isabellina]